MVNSKHSLRKWIISLMLLLLGAVLITTRIVPTLVKRTEMERALYVHVVTSNSFATELIFEYAAAYTAATGIEVVIRQTPSPDDAVVRANALKEPIDAILLPYVIYREYMGRGWLTELHDYLPQDITHTPTTKQRWVWGSIAGRVQCGYISGSLSRNDVSEPSFACLWHAALDKSLVAEFISYLVSKVPTVDSYSILALNYARKLYFEQDYDAIYDHLLHEESKSSKQAFIQQETLRVPCKTGTVRAIHLRQDGQNSNSLAVTSPRGTFYAAGKVMSYRLEVTCLTGAYDYPSLLQLTIDTAKLAGFMPHTDHNNW